MSEELLCESFDDEPGAVKDVFDDAASEDQDLSTLRKIRRRKPRMSFESAINKKNLSIDEMDDIFLADG